MNYAYVFKTRYGRLIITHETSKIGYCYPRFFVENKAKNSYTNIDLTIGGAFKQSKEDFESWLDGTEVTNKNFAEVCTEYNINLEGILDIAQKIFDKGTVLELKQDLKIKE